MHRVLKVFSFRVFLLSVVIISSGYCSAGGVLTQVGLLILSLACTDAHHGSTHTLSTTGLSSTGLNVIQTSNTSSIYYVPNPTATAHPMYFSQNLVPPTSGTPTQDPHNGAGSAFGNPVVLLGAVGAGLILADQGLSGARAIVGASVDGAKGLYNMVVGSDLDDTHAD